MGVVDVAREEHASVHFALVGPPLLAVLATGVEVDNLVGTKHVVHILGKFGLQEGHHGELLLKHQSREQVMR